ncbi:MAG TPA: ABC transporter ATP-binding protein [Desulfobacterales bacterium]|nr:ABC transporter ATP-binding protein [Desulfobacterales bacterium]
MKNGSTGSVFSGGDDPILKIDYLSQQFEAVKALIDVDLEVSPGEVLGLIGPNGSGKTTLLNVITGLYAPTQGEIFFKSQKINGLKTYQIIHLGISRTFQNLRIYGRMTVFNNIWGAQHSLSDRGIRRQFLMSRNQKKDREKVNHLLDLVGLYERREWLAKQLPLPDQRRLELARALIRAPQLLLLDEPAGGMTPKETEAMASLIQKIAIPGRTCIIIEHKMDMITALCNRLCVLNFGSKIAEGTPNEVLKNPLVLEAYLGYEEGAHA